VLTGASRNGVVGSNHFRLRSSTHSRLAELAAILLIESTFPHTVERDFAPQCFLFLGYHFLFRNVGEFWSGTLDSRLTRTDPRRDSHRWNSCARSYERYAAIHRCNINPFGSVHVRSKTSPDSIAHGRIPFPGISIRMKLR